MGGKIFLNDGVFWEEFGGQTFASARQIVLSRMPPFLFRQHPRVLTRDLLSFALPSTHSSFDP
jgi:hypothetical protein